MKSIFIPALLLGFTFASCNNKTDEMDRFNSGETPGLMNDSTDATHADTSIDDTANLDYDQLLDLYESYIDSYMALIKKAENDISAMKEYLAFMGKAQDLSSELDQKQGEMTSEQLNRFTDLKTKFAESLMTI